MEQRNPSGDRSRYAKLSKEERLREFMCTIAHPHFVATSKALQNAIQETGGASLVFVCGPVGVGKTAIKNHVLQWDKERAPILSLLARPPLHCSFSWREFLQNGISTLEQPLVGRRDTSDGGEDEENTHLAQPGESWSGSRPLTRTKDDDLRISLEAAIKRRCPAAVIIDNAQHLGKVSEGRQLQNQLDCLKSLAEVTETVHVHMDTYAMLLRQTYACETELVYTSEGAELQQMLGIKPQSAFSQEMSQPGSRAGFGVKERRPIRDQAERALRYFFSSFSTNTGGSHAHRPGTHTTLQTLPVF